MRIVLQRVHEAAVSIQGETHAKISAGLLIFLGITTEDTSTDIEWIFQKLINLRIFNDNENKMNLSLIETNGALLIVSQFTLFASTKKGNRPSFIKAAPPSIAQPLYNEFVSKAKKILPNVASGIFGADMQITLTNDGPVTLIIDSKNKE